MNKKLQWKLLAICFSCVTNAVAQEEGAGKIELGMELTSELQAAAHRGNHSATSGDAYPNTNHANLLRISASLTISRNVTLEASSISTCMTAAESIGGDLQTFSNTDAGNIPFALSTCGIGWQMNDHHALFAGIRNMNEDYFTSPVTSLFTNSSCGIFPTISANYSIANYPLASVGLHYRYEKDPLKVQASLYNGTGYNRFTGRENIFRVCPKSDGIFGITEIGYAGKGSYYSLGSALHYYKGTSPTLRMSVTPWLYAEQNISNGLTLLACYSHAFTSAPACQDFAGLGVRYESGKYKLGLFTDYAAFEEGNEFATELTCRIPLTSHLDIQPTAHIISTDGKLCCAAMLRMILSIL